MKRSDVDEFEKVVGQLHGLHGEMATLSKKSPDGPVNAFKLTLINKLLERSNSLLGDDYKPFAEFDLFDEDDMPSNSDVAMMTKQYLEAAEKMRGDNIRFERGMWSWVLDDDDDGPSVRTAPPSRAVPRK